MIQHIHIDSQVSSPAQVITIFRKPAHTTHSMPLSLLLSHYNCHNNGLRFCDNRIFNIQTNETFQNSFPNGTNVGQGRKRTSIRERTTNKRRVFSFNSNLGHSKFLGDSTPCCFCRPNSSNLGTNYK